MRRGYICAFTLAAAAVAHAQPFNNWSDLFLQGRAADMAGDYGRAAASYRAAARIAQSFGPTDSRYTLSWNGVGMMAHALGQFADAEAAYRLALAPLRDAASLDRATLLGNLGLLYLETGRPERAERLLREAVAIHDAAGRPDRIRLAIAQNTLAEYLTVTGRPGEAEPLLIATLRALEGVPNAETEVGIARNNLGVVRLYQGYPADAERLFEESLVVLPTDRGQNHPALVRTLNNLGTAQFRNGRASKARETFRRALDLAEKSLGDGHPLYAQVLDNYARYLRLHGEKAQSRSLAERAARILRENGRRNGIGATVDINALQMQKK